MKYLSASDFVTDPSVKLQFTELPNGLVCRVSARNEGGFDPDESIRIHAAIADTDRYVAIVNHSPFWCSPFWGKSLTELPDRTQELLVFDGSHWICFLPACDSVFKTVIRGDRDGFSFVLSDNCRCVTECNDQLSFVCMEGDDPLALCRDCAARAAELLGNGLRLRDEKPFPKPFERLGWCSWDAFGIRVSHEGLVEKAREFREKDVPIGFAIVDDMWGDAPMLKSVPTDATFGETVGVMHHSPLREFRGDPERFPDGMAGAIADLKANGISDVGVWFPTTGYWAGLDREGAAYRRLRAHLTETETGVFNPGTSIAIPAPERADAEVVMKDFCARACDWGADFVKIDYQGFHGHYRDLAPIGKSARALQGAIDAAADRYFGGALINCMGMPSECMFNRRSAVSRCSDDFIPEDRAWFIKNVLQCAYNGLLQGQYYYNDWDMWWTDDAQAEKNAVCRAISGGPIYVSDQLGRTNAAILRPLAYADGCILRPDESATPTADCLAVDPRKSGRPLKLRNRFGSCGVIAVFNLDAEERAVSGTVSAEDAGLPRGEYAWYEQFSGEWGIAEAGAHIDVTLRDADDYRLYRFAPFCKGGVTALGRLDLYMGVGAIREQDGRRIVLEEGGRIGLIIDHADRAPELLVRDLPREETEITLPVRV